MVWLTTVSFRRNLSKYLLAIVGLSLAITVSCLGLSGLDVLWQFTLRPLSFIGGGQVLIMDNRMSMRPLGSRLHAEAEEIKPFPSHWADEVISEIPGSDKAVRTLVVPFLWYTQEELDIAYLAGRDGLPDSLSDLRLLQGDAIRPDTVETQLLMPGTRWSQGLVQSWFGQSVGARPSLALPEATNIGGAYEWDLASTSDHSFALLGIYDGSASLYPVVWTTLSGLQSRVGAEELVSWVGIPCESDEMDALKARLEERIRERGLPMKVLTIMDLGRMLIGDFERFERMSKYYAPVMLFVAIQIVLVNAIALAMARRKDLALLRTIGVSLRQVQVMFVLECILSALSGGLVGTGLSALLSFALAKSAALNLVPFALTLATTTVVSAVATAVLTRGSLSQVLRNPAS